MKRNIPQVQIEIWRTEKSQFEIGEELRIYAIVMGLKDAEKLMGLE
jgi:hypothetical protein